MRPVVVSIFFGIVLAFSTVQVEATCYRACDGPACCCPVNCHPFCPWTEVRCYDVETGGPMATCINAGQSCPWSGCGGWSCQSLVTPEPTEVASVEMGSPIALSDEPPQVSQATPTCEVVSAVTITRSEKEPTFSVSSIREKK